MPYDTMYPYAQPCVTICPKRVLIAISIHFFLIYHFKTRNRKL